MKIDVLTLFPEMVQGPMTQSIIGKDHPKQEKLNLRQRISVSFQTINIIMSTTIHSVVELGCFLKGGAD